MNTGKLISDNPELLQYISDKLHITILGGIKFTSLDRLKVTLKIVCKEDMKKVFRHNVDLYNSIQTTQLTERVADFLDFPTDEITRVINDLTTVLENYRAAHLEALKPKVKEAKVLTDAERRSALTFLKSPDLFTCGWCFHHTTTIS